MSMKKPLFLAIATLLIICSCDSNDFSKAFETVSKEVKSEFAPDSRVKTFEAEIEKVGENLVLRGVTTEKEAKDALLSKLAENKIDILDLSF